MARTPTQDPDILAQDMQRLTRILRRAQENTTRPRKENLDLIASLKRSIQILAGSTEASLSSRKTGS